MRDNDCRVQVARILGDERSGAVLLPDGRLGWPEALAYTDEPFVAISKEQLRGELIEGPYRGFDSLVTDHYVIVTQGSKPFTEASGRLLESLYAGLLDSARRLGLPASESEFPLVAVIYGDEQAFREANHVAEHVEAYYDVATNRIHFFESSRSERDAPDLAARRKPQTVAHEGTHQILQNIGVQPRLTSWPPWLVEGLAEFFAPTSMSPGDIWDGANRINPFHMATLRELHDPLSRTLHEQGRPTLDYQRDPSLSWIEHVVGRAELNPIDYAIAWALTHFLFNTQHEELLTYLRTLSRREPGVVLGPAEHLADFRRHFGHDLVALDRLLGRHLGRLKDVQPLAHYAVVFERVLAPGVIRRAAIVSQSPVLIRHWLDENAAGQGGPATWRVLPFPTRSRAVLAAEGWLNRMQ